MRKKSSYRNKLITELLLLTLLSVLILTPVKAEGTAATIWTDKQDYAPEETVTICGSGFSPEVTVSITVTRPDSSKNEWVVTSDSSGSFTTTYPLDGITGTYIVTATDGTNTATTTFTDGPLVYSPTRYPATGEAEVVQGGSVSFVLSITADTADTYSSGVYDDIVGYTGIPTGWFSLSPTSLTFTTVPATKTTTVTITVPSTAATGVYAKKAKFSPRAGTGVDVYIKVEAAQKQITVTASPGGAIGGTFKVAYTKGGTTFTNQLKTTTWTEMVDTDSPVTVSEPLDIIYDASPGKRYKFDHYDPSSSVTMTTDKTITLVYDTYYLVTYAANVPVTVPADEWVKSGQAATGIFSSPQYNAAGDTKYVFVSDDRPATITAPTTITATYDTYYKVTFKQSGSDVAPKVTYSIDGGTSVQNTVQFSVWVDEDSSIAYTYESPVAGAAGTQYVLTSTSPASPQTITAALDVTGSYKTQFYITVTSAYDSPTLSDWVDEGSDFTAGVTSPVGDASHQWVCTGHSVDGGSEESGVSHTFTAVAAAHTIVFNWQEQWYITVTSAHDSPTASAWVNAGDDFTASVTSPDVVAAGHRWVCTGYSIDGGAPTAGTSYTFNDVDAAHEIVFNWQEQYYLTVNTSPPGSDSPTGEGWYDTGVTAHVSTAQYVDIVPGSSRYRFDSWTGATGTYADATVVMDSAKTATANYQLQYYLTLAKNPSDVAIAPSGAGWYDENAYASISTAQYVDIVSGSSRYRFNGWTTADMTEITDPTATSTTVKMDKAKTVTANYVTQYKVTFTQTGLDGTAIGTVVTIDGEAKTYGDLPFSIWVDSGDTVEYSYEVLVASSEDDKQFWLESVTGPSSPITAAEPVTIVGNYLALPLSQVTDSSLRYDPVFDVSSAEGQQFRLIFTQDPTSPSTYRLTASNPGQFYYNVFYIGDPGDTITLEITIPYPFVTQGAVPIHVYCYVDKVGGCYVPYGELSDFGISGSSTITVSGTVPASGLVYVTIHLDYGLKKTVGYNLGDGNNANNGLTSISNHESYTFSYAVGGSISTTVDSQPIGSENVFKRDPGFAGLVTDSSGNPVKGVRVQIYGPDGKLIATVNTDEDGWYVYNYKHTGKAATFTVNLPDYKLQQSVTLKANSFVVVNFQIP